MFNVASLFGLFPTFLFIVLLAMGNMDTFFVPQDFAFWNLYLLALLNRDIPAVLFFFHCTLPILLGPALLPAFYGTLFIVDGFTFLFPDVIVFSRALGRLLGTPGG